MASYMLAKGSAIELYPPVQLICIIHLTTCTTCLLSVPGLASKYYVSLSHHIFFVASNL